MACSLSGRPWPASLTGQKHRRTRYPVAATTSMFSRKNSTMRSHRTCPRTPREWWRRCRGPSRTSHSVNLQPSRPGRPSRHGSCTAIRDTAIPPQLPTFMAERARPRAMSVVEGASHVVMISHSDAVAKVVGGGNRLLSARMSSDRKGSHRIVRASWNSPAPGLSETPAHVGLRQPQQWLDGLPLCAFLPSYSQRTPSPYRSVSGKANRSTSTANDKTRIAPATMRRSFPVRCSAPTISIRTRASAVIAM
jgi:hypothetical protein